MLSPRIRLNVLYNYIHLQQQARGRNLNAPVDGVRPDPTLANVIEAVTDTEIRRHEVFVNTTISLVALSPALNQARVNWKRLSMNASYSLIHARNNSAGFFAVPPTGNVDDDWGPGPADSPYRIQLLLTSTQIKNVTANIAWLANSGFPYTLTTGFDDNRDGLINDRPPGVGLRTLRMAGQSAMNARFMYTFALSGATPGAAGHVGTPSPESLRQREQPDEPPEPRRLQRRDDLAVLHASDAGVQSAQREHGRERQFLACRT